MWISQVHPVYCFYLFVCLCLCVGCFQLSPPPPVLPSPPWLPPARPSAPPRSSNPLITETYLASTYASSWFDEYHSTLEIEQTLKFLAGSQNAHVVYEPGVGTSVEGRRIGAFFVGSPSAQNRVMVNSGMHAREWISPAAVLCAIKQILLVRCFSVALGRESGLWKGMQVVLFRCRRLLPTGSMQSKVLLFIFSVQDWEFRMP